jgi:hypothetical protein
MKNSKDKTKISIQLHGLEISAQIDKDDPSPKQMFELFRAVFLGCTYTWEQWHAEIRRQAEEGE